MTDIRDTKDIDNLVISWLTRGVKLSEEMAREAVAEIRWTERRESGFVSDPCGPDEQLCHERCVRCGGSYRGRSRSGDPDGDVYEQGPWDAWGSEDPWK